jgi:hypothetical protein
MSKKNSESVGLSVSKSESNRDKFVRIAESRTIKAIKSIRSISKLSDRSNYSYTDNDVKKIISSLKNELSYLQKKFENVSSSEDVVFKL